MKNVASLAFVLVFALVAASCGETSNAGGLPAPTTSPIDSSPVTTSPVGSDADFLAGTDWVAVLLQEQGRDALAVTDPGAPTLRFDDSAANAAGWTTCNTYGASVAVGAGTITFDDLFVTEAACLDSSLMEREAAMLRILIGTTAFTFADGVLTLFGDAGSIAFEQPEPVVDASLDDTLWVLTTLINGEAASSVLSTTTPTMTIDTTSGSLRGTTGCNDYFADLQIEDTLLTLSELGWTEVGCESQVMAQEASILEVLQTVERFSIEGDRLTLVGAEGRALVFRAG